MAWTNSDFTGTRWSEKRDYAVFVAKTGNDANSGSPKSPLLTLAAAAALARSRALSSGGANDAYRYVVVGSGVYSESSDFSFITIIGDGEVELNGSSAAYFDSGIGPFNLNNLTFKNYGTFCARGWTSVNANQVFFSNINVLYSAYVGHFIAWSNCVVKDCFAGQNPGFYNEITVAFERCNFLNTRLKTAKDLNTRLAATYRNCYFDARSGPDFVADDPRWSIVNCNVQGTVVIGSVSASIEQIQAARPTQAYGNLNVAPGFNNPAHLDYTLAPGSAMRHAGTDGGAIGAYGVGFNFSGPADLDGASAGGGLVNMVWHSSSSQFQLVDATQKGTVEFSIKNLGRPWAADRLILVGPADDDDQPGIDATLSYDNTGGVANDFGSGPFTASEAGSIYWVKDYITVTYNGITYNTDSFIYISGAGSFTTVGAGKLVRILELPNLRTLELKSSLVSAADCAGQEWKHFVYGKAATVDAEGNSNASPQYNPATAVPIAAQYAKVRLTLHPDSLA